MSTIKKKDLWGQVINVVIAILSAVATTLGLNSCM
ncbi:smalltalk protein [Hymenobacter terricola]